MVPGIVDRVRNPMRLILSLCAATAGLGATATDAAPVVAWGAPQETT